MPSLPAEAEGSFPVAAVNSRTPGVPLLVAVIKVGSICSHCLVGIIVTATLSVSKARDQVGNGKAPSGRLGKIQFLTQEGSLCVLKVQSQGPGPEAYESPPA